MVLLSGAVIITDCISSIVDWKRQRVKKVVCLASCRYEYQKNLFQYNAGYLACRQKMKVLRETGIIVKRSESDYIL